jgi:hypothetical protein
MGFVVCQGFYEWLKKGPGGKEKVPHFIRRKDGELMCFVRTCANYFVSPISLSPYIRKACTCPHRKHSPIVQLLRVVEKGARGQGKGSTFYPAQRWGADVLCWTIRVRVELFVRTCANYFVSPISLSPYIRKACTCPHRRCVVVCQGFYEWLKKGPGGKEKVPHFIRRKDGEPPFSTTRKSPGRRQHTSFVASW